MSTGFNNLYKQEEPCIYRYKADCARIEQQQYSRKKQHNALKEIEEQMLMDATDAYEYFDSYANSNDLRQYQTMVARGNNMTGLYQ